MAATAGPCCAPIAREPLPATDAFDLTAPTVSHHLKVLRTDGSRPVGVPSTSCRRSPFDWQRRMSPA
ncbi:ArsR family transcriptional regulator [Nonomuraea sp. SYSU D8015]|uniref:ArsR family transcriptional regulator n=1 Tax=Nonomuraea sp. SYSU D8015 TaxID=2593644 RepID=UPI001CB734BF|nr:ArsR family transcriptional regulator [Nonomuraea sp. SYSU D8015]